MDSYDVDFGSIDRVMDEILGNGGSFQDYIERTYRRRNAVIILKKFYRYKEVITGVLVLLMNFLYK